MRIVRSALLAVPIASVLVGGASAQEPGEPDPLRLTVRPRGVEETTAERLARRAERLDFAFRFICKGCGTAPNLSPAPDTPFDPAGVLSRR